MRIRRIIIISIITTLVLSASGGSIYSRYGLGESTFGLSGKLYGLGQTALAYKGINTLNPANLSSMTDISTTFLEAGLYYKGAKIRDNKSASFYSDLFFNGAVLAMPVYREYGIALAGGILPLTRTNYEIVKDDALFGVNTISGEGSLSKLFIASSYRTPFDLSLGFSFNYYLGRNEYSSKYKDNLASDYVYGFTDSYGYKGTGLSLGMTSPDFAKLLNIKEIDEFRIALSYEAEANLTTNYKEKRFSNIGVDTAAVERFTSKYPKAFGAGFSMKFANKYTLLADYYYQNWKSANNETYMSNLMVDSERYSIGLEYKENKTDSRNFFDKMTYRIGFSVENTNLEINKERIKEYLFYGGLTVPFAANFNMDLGLSYGIKGVRDELLNKENRLNLFVSFNLGELWFIREEK